MSDVFDLQEPTEEQLVEAERDLPVRKFFSYAHLPGHLASGSRPFCELAYHVIATIKRTAERTIALRRILDAKDQAVRCLLLAVVALVFVGCTREPRPPATWHGIDATAARCHWQYDRDVNGHRGSTGAGTCVANGRAYLCVADDVNNRVDCAALGEAAPTERAPAPDAGSSTGADGGAQ